MNDGQLLRYSRHILLGEFGVEGQERLLAAHAVIVGAGGLGSPAALYLAAAGVGRITLVDGDVVDLTNLQRQILHRVSGVGRPKVESGRATLAEINPEIEVVALQQRAGAAELDQLAESADVLLDGSDNFATRHAVNRACVAHATPLVSGAAIRFDGQLAVFDSRDETSPCYQCLFPQDGELEEVRCAVMGVFAPLTGIVGTMQAAEAIKLITGCGEPMTGRLLLIDALAASYRSLKVNRDPACAVCGSLGARPQSNHGAAANGRNP
jgi:adenylyltransferase/sulfurtransferase